MEKVRASVRGKKASPGLVMAVPQDDLHQSWGKDSDRASTGVATKRDTGDAGVVLRLSSDHCSDGRYTTLYTDSNCPVRSPRLIYKSARLVANMCMCSWM